jgi:hypothetical protein
MLVVLTPNDQIRTMRVVQTFTKQDMMPFHWALFYAMDGIVTYEAMTGAEEQICIVRGETRQGIKNKAINGHRYWGREGGTSIEGVPVGVVMI